MGIETFLIWIVTGLIAGWVAGEMTRGHGFGVVGNIVLGIVGAFLGGLIFSALGIATVGWLGSFIAAVVGSVVLVLIASALRSPATV